MIILQRNPTMNEQILIGDTTRWETMGIVQVQEETLQVLKTYNNHCMKQ